MNCKLFLKQLPSFPLIPKSFILYIQLCFHLPRGKQTGICIYGITIPFKKLNGKNKAELLSFS